MMNKALVFLIFSPIVFNVSCKSQETILGNKLKKCINTRINNNDYKFEKSSIDINYYKIISDIENYFIDENILVNTSKEEYYKLIDEIINSDEDSFYKKTYKDVLSIMNRSNYNGLYFSSDVLQNCPHYILESEEKITSSFTNQFDAMDKLIAFDPYGQDFINELVMTVSEKDFKNIVYRAPIITILYEFIQFKQQEVKN